MDLPKLTLPRLEYRTPMQHCLNLIKEADDMLVQIQRPIKQKKKEKEQNKITPEFLRAVKSLSTRFKSYNKIENTSTRPVQTVVEKLGPGCYNIERSFTPIAAPLNFLLDKPSKGN